jgi:cation:H+ antiporter
MLLAIALFAACALLLAVAGWKLIEAVDIIAERTGIGRAFMGMILVATVTSLPELSTSVSAVAIADAPDLAVGNVVGACVVNLMLFAVADVASPKTIFYGRLSRTHNLTAAFSLILLGLLALALLAPTTARLAVGHVGLYSIGLALLYFVGARLLYLIDLRSTPDAEPMAQTREMTLRSALLRCAAASLVVIGAGAALAMSANAIAEAAGLTDSLVGVLFLGAATTTPELVTILVAMRLKAFDLAAGNLLGSNLFNMVVLVIDDIAYVDGPLFASASPDLAAPVVIAMVMTAVIVGALNYVRRADPRHVDAWVDAALAALYLLNAWLIHAGIR